MLMLDSASVKPTSESIDSGRDSHEVDDLIAVIVTVYVATDVADDCNLHCALTPLLMRCGLPVSIYRSTQFPLPIVRNSLQLWSSLKNSLQQPIAAIIAVWCL